MRSRHGGALRACSTWASSTSLQTADLAAALGLPGILSSSARLCLDKSVMRRRFHEWIGPAAAARFHVVTSESDLIEFANQLGYPVFLQPSNVAASMWATRNTHPEALLCNYRTMLSEVPEYYEKLGKKDTRLTVVLAEYLEGTNTSIDCLVDHQGRAYTTPVVDVLTGRDVGIDDFHHFARLVPSRLGAPEQEELRRLAVAGVQALGMTTCAAHVEFIGPRLGEIAARPGGNRPRILDLAYGIDEIHAYCQVLCGQRPDLRQDARRQRPFSRRLHAATAPCGPSAISTCSRDCPAISTTKCGFNPANPSALPRAATGPRSTWS